MRELQLMGEDANGIAVTRERDFLRACVGERSITGYFDNRQDDELVENIRGTEAILAHRAQERQAKTTEERDAGVQALLEEAWPEGEWVDVAASDDRREFASRLYDKGYRAKSPEPAEPRPFQVGDVVQVAGNATWTSVTGKGAKLSTARGKRATITRGPDEFGDFELLGPAFAHRSFLALVTPAAKP